MIGRLSSSVHDPLKPSRVGPGCAARVGEDRLVMAPEVNDLQLREERGHFLVDRYPELLVSLALYDSDETLIDIAHCMRRTSDI
jgi:hypothetical protein